MATNAQKKQNERMNKFMQMHQSYTSGQTVTGQKDNDTVINSFLRDSRNYIREADSELKRMSWKDATDPEKQNTRNKVSNNISQRSKQARSILESSKDNIDPDRYKVLMEYLDDFDNDVAAIGKETENLKSYYSKWKSEEEYTSDYQNYVNQKRDREEKGKFDLISGQKEIDDLEAERQKILDEKKSRNAGANGRPYAVGQQDAPNFDSFTTGYGITNNRPYAAGLQVQKEETPEDTRLREIDQLISKKKQYLNQAKHIQEINAYDDTVKNADFDKYDDYAESDDTLYNWINNPQFRESYEASYQSIPNSNARRSKYVRKGYDRMSASEIAIFNYYYAKSGKEAAQKYLDTIQERLNERTAEEMYSAVQDDVAAELVFGVSAGLNQFGSNVANNFRFKDDYIAKSAHQIASEMVREDLADNGPKLPEILGGASLGQIAYDAVTTGANMAPSILVGMATGVPVLGTATMGLSAAGGAYQQALNEGYDKNQARGYSILVGASEMAMEKLLGGISAVGGNALGFNAVKNIANADKALLAIAKRVGGSALSEFGEEYLQEVLDPVFSNIMLKTDKEVKPISAEAIYSGILGMLTGAIMESPSAIYGETQTASTGRKLKEAGVVDSLAKIGNTFAADTVAYKLAGKVNENTGAYTIGQLFNEIGATVTEQNISEIAEVLMQTGNFDESTAKKNAQVLAAVVAGAELSRRDVAIIESNDALADAARKVLIDQNTTWNQRTQGYNEVLRKLAMDKVTGKKSGKVTPATDQKSLQVDKNSLTTAEESSAVENENAPSGAQAVEGIDIHTGTQEAVSTDKIKSITKDGVVFAQEDGSEVSSKDVAYADAEDGLIFEAFTEMRELGTDAANEIISIRRKAGGSGQLFANVMRIAYEYGYANLSEAGLLAKTYHGNIPTGAVQRIYQIGKEARAAEDARRAQAKKSIVGGKTEVYRLTETGEVKQLGEGKEALKVLAVNERKSVGVKTAQFLQKIGVGGNYYFIQSYTDKDGNRLFLDRNGNVQDAHNGMYYSNGDIYIDLNAEVGSSGITLFTISHELAHFVQQWNAEKYKVLADFLAKHYAKNGASAYRAIKIKQQTLSEKRGTKVSFEEAYHEFVADSLSTMFSDGNIYEKLLDLKKTDKSVFDKIRSYINKLAQKAKAYYSGEIAPTTEGQFMQMQSKETIDQLQQLFADALVGASENYRNAETQKNTGQEVGVQYSDSISSFKKDKYFESQIKKWEELKHGSYVKVGTLGKSHPIVQVGMPEGALRYDVSKLKKNMQDHGDYLTSDLLAVIPDIISNPVVITEYSQKNTISVFGEYFVGKSPMMVGITISRDRAGNDISKVRTFNARRDVGQQITDNTVLYLGENKKRTLNWFQACGIQVPLGGTKFGFIRSISQNASGVNQNSDVNSEPVSNRSLLANAMESLAKTELEKKKLTEYKAKIDQINAEEQKLSEVRAQIKELSFEKGPRDKEKLRALRDEAIKLSHHIGIYDKQLLRLEASKPLQNVLDREKAKAYQRGKEKGEAALKEYKQKAMTEQEQMKKRYEESRKRSVENRNKTAMRHKIQNVVKELNSLLLTNDKKRRVPDNLKKAVAAALDLVNMDTVDAENRAAKYADLIAKEQAKANPDQDKIDSYTMTMENILRQGEKMGQRLKELHSAYEEIQNSDDPDIANAHDNAISAQIMVLAVRVGDTPLRDMTMEQLSDVYDVYRAVLTRVRDANKAMAENIRASIEELAKSTIREVQTVGGSKKYRVSNLDAVRKFDWNNMKPVYAMERIGSSTLTEVFNNVRAGEDTWAKDVSEAREYFLEKSKKYGYDKWDFDKKYRFESNSGIPFELTLEQILSLYAYSKREQAADHLRIGGFVFDSNIETYKEKDGKKSLLKYKVNTADAHQITPEIMADIIGKLSKEQAGFVDEMQDYLSTVMGAKGNEVTSKMYGVKLFKEKFYFPLKSAKQYMFEKNEVAGEVRIKNSGFTNKVVAKANNPVILSNFMDVWSGHVNDMSMYHAFTLPLEDFNRVFNYNSPKKDGVEPVSVKGTIQNAYGPAAVSYVKQLITDLNGGARTDSTTGMINKLTGMFKKGAVFASLSVVVQQPSAIARAAALVDTKYFIGPKVDHKRHKYLWAEVKKYAPVAIIKEMGYFDTNMGKSTQDFITGKEYSGIGEKAKAVVTDSSYRDELLSKAPALADEYAWCGIWAAVKRETKAKHPSMDTTSEAFLKLAGKRFTEVITKTQVYDSVLARSANMRSKDTGMKMATAFMAEPTTSINMIEDAIWKAKRGDKKYSGKAIGAVIASQILNAILVSFVYAGRDDDDDETYAEKYIGALTGSLVDGLNVATYIPFIKDIVSITQGYDVERSDMAVVSDLWNAWKNLKNDKVSPYRKVENFAGSIAQIFGLPLKNIMRDVRGIYNTITNLAGAEQTTGSGVKYAISGAITGKTVSDKEQLYKARLDGDKQHAARVAARYDDEDSADAAVRAAIKDSFMADEIDEATALKHMVLYAGMDGSEAHWTMDEWKYQIEKGTSDGYSRYNKIYDAIKNGKSISAAVKEFTSNGYEEKDVLSEVKGNIGEWYRKGEITKQEATSMLGKNFDLDSEEVEDTVKKWSSKVDTGIAYDDIKEEYMDGNITSAKAIDMYVKYGGYDREEAEEKIADFDFEKKYGFAYGDRKEAYLDGKVSRAVLTDILVDHGYNEDDADAQVDVYEWQEEGLDDISIKAVQTYRTWAEPAGIPKAVYYSYWKFDNATENTRDPITGKVINGTAVKKIMAYINSLNLTDAQKDALAKCAGWKDSTIKKNKLW